LAEGVVVEVIGKMEGIRVINATGKQTTFIFSSECEDGKFYELQEGEEFSIGINPVHIEDEDDDEEEEDVLDN
jgi:hypothetical protein